MVLYIFLYFYDKKINTISKKFHIGIFDVVDTH